MWKFDLDAVLKPSNKSFQMQDKFVEWLKSQKVETIVNFELLIRTKYEVSENEEHAREQHLQNRSNETWVTNML